MPAARFTSVTLVLVARDACPDIGLLRGFYEELDRQFVDVETVIVANEPDPETSLRLKALAEAVPDALIVFLADRLHDDLARLIGIDYSVSDFILFATPSAAELAGFEAFEAPLRRGCDLIIGRPPGSGRRGGVHRLLFAIFSTLFRWTTGRVYEDDPGAFRMLSRPAALYVATRKDGEILVRARTLGSGFPAAEVPLRSEPALAVRRRSLRQDLARGARFIATGSSTLLRVSAYLAVLGGIASAIYSLYVLMIYFLYPHVAPGWTTLSLQLSGMLLLFSVQFLLLSEHVLQMGGTGAVGSRRHHVVREIRSPLSRRLGRLNIVDEEGRFKMGAPAELTREEPSA